VRLGRLRRTIWSSAFYRHGRRIAAAIARPFWHFEAAVIFQEDLAGPIQIFNSDVDLEMGLASAEEVACAADSVGRAAPDRRELFRWRLRDGCVCFVARSGSTLVGYAWMRYRPGVDDGDMIALADGEVYHFDGYMAEAWRGHRVHPALSSRLLCYDQADGYTRAYTKVSVFNRKSQKTVRRIGFKPSGLVLRVRGSRRGGWPIVTLWGSSHPLTRMGRDSCG
jgi:GNAT superfamily N-acetyltransferase